MVNQHTVSAVIPVHNCRRYLAEAIGTALAQTHLPCEIILVDDGSTDASAEVAKGFGGRVRYYRQEHAGIGAARNTGVELAQGEFLAFLDADDLWASFKTEAQLKVFATHPEIDMVFGLTQQFISPDIDAGTGNPFVCPAEPSKGQMAGSMLIRRDAFLRVGLFDPGLRVGEFLDWYLRAQALALKPFFLAKVVLRRRIHGNNTVLREHASQLDYVRVLKAALDRRRAINSSASGGSHEKDGLLRP